MYNVNNTDDKTTLCLPPCVNGYPFVSQVHNNANPREPPKLPIMRFLYIENRLFDLEMILVSSYNYAKSQAYYAASNACL